jgi:mannan polymerase II complex MNN10 subunit
VLDSEGKLRNEPDVLRDMLHDNAYSVADKSVVAPQWMFDAYPKDIDCYDPRDPRPWEPGMFLLHFAGARWKFREQKDPIGTLMRRYFSLSVNR